MEQDFKDKLSTDPSLQAKVLDILKATEVGKAYTETVAKNYFEQNIGQEHRKIYDFVDDAIKQNGFDKPDGVKTSEWVNMIAKQIKELNDKVNNLNANPNKLAEQIDALTLKHRKEKDVFNKTAQAEIDSRDLQIKTLQEAQTTLSKQTDIQNAMSGLEFNKGLDESLLKDIVTVKTQILIQNSKVEDGAVVWYKTDGTPYKDGILNASLDTILKNELSSVLHKSTAGGNAGTQNPTSGTFNGQQVTVDASQFKTQEQFLNEFNKIAQSKGIAKGEQYDSLYWEAFERYDVKQLKEY